jgi:hypothetical protein
LVLPFDADLRPLEADLLLPFDAVLLRPLDADLLLPFDAVLVLPFEADLLLLFDADLLLPFDAALLLPLEADLRVPLPADFFEADLLRPFEAALDLPFDADFFGTFSPSSRASESPIAIACLREVTFAPLPLRSFPSFFSRITFSTFFPAPLEYFAIVF